MSAFLSDLDAWTAELKAESASDEPTPLRPRNQSAPIRSVPTRTVNATGPAKPKKADGGDDEAATRMPTEKDFARAAAMLNGGAGMADPDGPEEDLSVDGASVDVERTLRAMKGATPQEKRWVAMREKEKGNELFKAKEFRSAIEAYTLSLTLDPESAAVYANRAAAYMKQRRWHEAEADCTAALAAEPGYFKALMRRGAIRLETGEAGAESAALEDLKAAELIEPDNKELQRLKAKAQRLVTDKYERKKMKRMTITETEDDDAAAEPKEAKKGFSFDGAKKPTATKTDRQAATQVVEPPAASSAFGPPPPLRTGPIDQASEAEEAKARGNAHFKARRFAEAAAAYTEALVNMPGMASAYCNRSGACFHLGDYEGAIGDASSALALDPGYAKALHRRAAARRASGDTDGASRDYDAAIALAPANAELKAEKKEMLEEARRASLKPARQGPMVIEEIEEDQEQPEPQQQQPVAADTDVGSGRKKIQIQEDSDDDEDDAAPEAAPPPVAASDAAPPTSSGSRRRVAIVEDDDDSSEDEEAAPGKDAASVNVKRAPTEDEKEAAGAIKKAGDEAFKRGEMEAAEALYTGCLASPGGASFELAVRANRSAARLKLEHFVGAEDDASAVLVLDPSHVKAAHRRAAARVKLGKLEEALVDYAVVKRAFPRHKGVLAEVEEAEAMYERAKAAGTLQKPETSPSVKKAEASSSSAPKAMLQTSSGSGASSAEEDVAALKQKGNDAFVRQRYHDALGHYTGAIAAAEKTKDGALIAVLFANRAATHLKLGDYAAAEKDASDAIASDGAYVKGYHRRAAALSAQGKFEKALEDYETVVRANPDNKTLQSEVNACMQKAAEAMLGGMDFGGLGGASGAGSGGASEGARGTGGRKAIVIEEDSDDSDEEEEEEEAAAAPVAGTENAPEASKPVDPPAANATSIGGRQRIAIVEEDSSEEEDETAAEVEVDEPPPTERVTAPVAKRDVAAAEAAKEKGNALFKAGDFDRAEAAFTEALTHDDSSVACLANRAAARLKRDDFAGAASDASAAIALDPSHVKAHHRLAIALARLGQHAAAVEAYETVQAALPGHAGVAAEAAAARASAAAEKAAKAADALAKKPKPDEASVDIEEVRAHSEAKAAVSTSNASSASRPSKRDVSAKAEAAAAKLAEKRPQNKPRTGVAFERGCRSLRGKTGELSDFVGQLSDVELVRVVKDSVSANILGAYAEVFSKGWMPAGQTERVAEVASTLAGMPRFSINAMLMTKSDKAAMKEVFDALGEDAAETRKAWKV